MKEEKFKSLNGMVSTVNYDERYNFYDHKLDAKSEEKVESLNRVVTTISNGEIKTIFGLLELLFDIENNLEEYADNHAPKDEVKNLSLLTTLAAVTRIQRSLSYIITRQLTWEYDGSIKKSLLKELINYIRDNKDSDTEESQKNVDSALNLLESFV